MFPIGYMYNKKFDYNIWFPICNTMESQGKAIQMGWKDRLDVLEWIQLAPTITKQSQYYSPYINGSRYNNDVIG